MVTALVSEYFLSSAEFLHTQCIWDQGLSQGQMDGRRDGIVGDGDFPLVHAHDGDTSDDGLLIMSSG